MRTFSICALALMGCSLTGKLNLPTLTTTSNDAEEQPPARARSMPTPAYESAGNGPMATPVVKAGPAPASYAWCAKVKPAGDNHLDRALTDDDPDRAIPAIAQYLCQSDSEAKAKRNELEARRQYWMQRMAMNEADWAADVPAWAAVSYSHRNTATVPPDANLAWSNMAPVEQFALLAMKTGASAALSLRPGGKTYIADALPLTQAGRVAFIDQCIHTNWDNEVHPVEWAMCQPDIDALDGAKFGAELRADTAANSYDRMVVRVAWANLGPKLAAHAAKVKALVATDGAYAKMFSIARDTHKEWPAVASTHAAALTTLRAIDDARATGSRKAMAAFAGCGEKTWTAFGAELRKLPAKGFIDLVDSKETTLSSGFASLMGMDTYLTAVAYVTCASAKDSAAQLLAGTFQYWPGYRGPRTSTLSKLLLANLEPDRGEYEHPASTFPLSAAGDFRHAGEGDAQGVIDSVTTTGDMMRVSFVSDIRDVDVCVSWRTSNRIWRIEPSGEVRYHQECTKREIKKNNFAPKPVTFHKRFAPGIVKGAFVFVSDGVVIAAAPKPGAPPTAVFGFAVK